MPDLVLTFAGGELRAELVHLFERSEQSVSSGQSFTIKALAQAVFDARPEVSRLAYVVTTGRIPLMLAEVSHQWFDPMSTPVQISRGKGISGRATGNAEA